MIHKTHTRNKNLIFSCRRLAVILICFIITGLSWADITTPTEQINNQGHIIPLASKYTVLAGDIIPSVMISGLNSEIPGIVIAQVAQDIFDTVSGRYLLIPKGSRLIGAYDNHTIFLQQRLLLAWNRIIFPNGSSYILHNMPGQDMAGFAGFYNSQGIDNHYWQIFGSSFIIGLISGGMQLSQSSANNNANNANNTSNANTTNNTSATAQTMSNNLGQQLGQTGMAITQKGLSVNPTITIPPGYLFNIMIALDLQLEEYHA